MARAAAAERPVVTSWQPQLDKPGADRLGYLGRGRCEEPFGCPDPAAARPLRELAGDDIDAFDLGDYGPLNVKFTGKRVKLKVAF
jgi:hypothetical protein